MNKPQYDKIRTYFQENKRNVILLCITELLFNALMCLVPIFLGLVVNAFAQGASVHEIVRKTIIYIGIVVFVQLNRLCKRYLGRDFENRIVLRMREVGYHNLYHMDMKFYTQSSNGDILNKMLTDIADAANGISKMTMETFDTIVLFLGYLISMFWMDVQITLIVTIFIVISIISAKGFKRYISSRMKEYKEYLSESKEITLTCLKNELNYRSLGVSGTYRNRFCDVQGILEKKGIRAMIMQGCLEPIYSMLTWLGLFFIVWLGGSRVISGSMSIGVFSAYLSTYLLISKKASRIGRVYGWYQNLVISWKRCVPYLTEKHDSRDEFIKNDDNLVLKNFSFGFDDQFKLPPISLNFKKGQKIGVCGSVHSGKSTFLAGLTGLYPYDGDAVLFGNDIKTTSCKIGYCPAKSLIFEDTLEQNIRIGRDGDVTQAIEDAGLSEDIALFQDKKEQYLSHSQVNLSGGQQKRLMIARAVYQRPPLILLDDPFQSIDRKNSQNIWENLCSYHDSIILAVTNQKFLLEKMDQIIFLTDQGYEVGTFAELSRKYDFETFQEVNR